METKNYMNFAKRLVMVLAVGLMAVNMWATDAVITFANTDGSDGTTAYTSANFVSDGIASSDAAFGTITCSGNPTKCFKGKSDFGLKLGGSGNAGSFTISFSTPIENVTKITLSRAAYNASKTTTITVKHGETTLANAVGTGTTATLNNMVIDNLSIESLGSLTVSSGQYCYVKSITITYTSGDAITLHKNNDDATGSTAGAGTIAADATTMTIGTTPTRAGYHVEGYYTAATEGTKIATAEGALQAGVTVDAKTWTDNTSKWKKGGAATFYTYWEANNYQVAFDKNGGTGSMENETGFSYGTAKALTECSFTAPEHKYFLGWNTDKNATTATYTDGASVSNLTTENNGTVTLYAIWADHTYKNYRTKCCVKLDAPENVEVSVMGTQAATVTWDDVENADGYEYSLDNGENWTAATSPLSLTSAQGLEGATEYSIQVRATGDGTTYCAEGTAADAVAFKTWSTVTAASNDALMGTAQVSLTSGSDWANSVDAADGTKIYLKYTAASDNYEWYEWATPASGSISDNEFTGWSGNVTVTANFRTKSLTKLATPEGMASSSVTAISAVVSWTAVEHASGYTVTCEKTSDGSTTGIVIGDVNGTSCTISGLTANTGYTWTVKAVGDNSSYKDGDACEGQTFTTDKKKPATVEITTAPSKTVYNSGETFDATGMVVKVTYNNGDIDAAYTGYTVSPSTALSPSNTYVTVTATMNEASASVEQAITVNAKLTWKAAGAADVTTYASAGKVVMPTGSNPTAPSCLGDFDTFQGWSASAIAISTTSEPSYVSAETDATTDATFYAVFAKMGEGDEEDASSTLQVKQSTEIESPYEAADGTTWTFDNLVFANTASAGITASSATIVMALPTHTGVTSVEITGTSNQWGKAENVYLTLTGNGIEGAIGTLAKGSMSYSFIDADKTANKHKASSYTLTKGGSSSAWIDHITINYKKVGQEPKEWATTCCTEWSAPTISYDVPNGWKYGDDPVEVEIAAGTTYGAVTYESSNTAVLTVATDGAITAVAPGTATVTATWAGATVLGTKYCEASSTSATITVTGTLTIQFVGGEGTTGSMDNQTVTYNVAEAISNNGFSKAGHTFAGWALTDGGDKAYDNQESVAFTENTTLYALWSLNHHNVTLTQPTVSEVAAGTIKANNSTTSPASVDYGTTVTLTATENEGYAFDSWSVSGASLASAATVKDNSFSMPDNDVTVTATYHAYTWDLTSYEVTSEVQLSYTDVQTFDKNGVVIKGNYERSDTKETKQETYEGAWTAKLGDAEIAHNYAFTLADDKKHLTFWIGENKFFDEEVAVTEVTKDHFVDKLWGNTEIIRSGENYDMPSLENGAEGGSEATCRDHRFFMGWVLAANDENPTDNLIAATGKQSVAEADRTFYAVWAKNVERDLAAGYRQITSAPAGGDSVILAALSGTKYYAIGNSNGSAGEIALTNGVVTSPNGFGFKVVSATGGLKFQAGSKYMHFNASSFNVANSDGNGIAALTAVDGAFKIKGTTQARYLKFTGSAFAVDATESNYTPIYIFKKQAAGKETVKGDYITDCTPRHTISFNVNGGKGSYDAVQKKEGATITLPVPVEAEYKDWHTYAGWKVANAGELLETTYTVGDKDVTLYAQWNEVSKADVIFKDGETTVQTKSGIHQGETYNLKEALSADNKQFTGWLNGGVLYDAEEEMTMVTPAEELVYEAQWMTVKPEPAPAVDFSGGKWILVTNENQLNAGDMIVIAAADYAYAISTSQGSNNRNKTAITKNVDTLTITSEVAPLFLQNGYVEGSFALFDRAYDSGNGGYLYAAGSGSKNNYLRTQAIIDREASWKITITDKKALIVAQGDNTNNTLRFNSGSNVNANQLFSCYSSGQSDVTIYKWYKTLAAGETNVASVEWTDAVIVPNGATLNVPTDATLDNVIVENGGQVTVADNKTLEVNDLTIQSKAGESGQLIKGTGSSVMVTGDIYMDVKFYSAATLDETSANQWYMISAPFDVNLADGFINPVSGVTMHRGNDDNVNTFDLFYYDGEKRAKTGTTGWTRVQGQMPAGRACLIGFNPGQPTTIRLKAASNVINNPTSITLAGNTSTVGETEAERTANSNWNGVANPTFHYTDLDKDAYIWNNEEGENGRKYNVYSAGSCTFVVGTPLFIQGNTSASLTAATNTQFRAPKRNADERIEYCVRITREGANDFADQMYVRASEEATNTYEQGHDMITWNGTSGKSALLWSENYGMRLAIEEAPLVNNGATYVLGLYAPADGVYTISTPTEDEDATLYLTQNGHIIWNLSQGAYTAELQQGQKSGYGLKIVAAPKVYTDVEQSVVSDQPSVQKVIIDEHVYILRGGQMYDVNGKMVK